MSVLWMRPGNTYLSYSSSMRCGLFTLQRPLDTYEVLEGLNGTLSTIHCKLRIFEDLRVLERLVQS